MSQYWKIPDGHSAEFVAAMEDILAVYHRLYDANSLEVGIDESPKQPLGHCRAPWPMLPGSVEKVDDEYVLVGKAELFLAIESLTGFMEVNVEEHRAKGDWAEFIKQLIDVQYPMQKICVGYG